MNTFVIYKKELRNYFNSSIAYVFFGFFLVIVGMFFYLSMMRYSQLSFLATRNMNMDMMERFNPRDVVLSPLFSLMSFLLIFLIPVITMRLFSEEKKLGTIELLFTYPVTEMQMVLGKFLAAVTVLVFIYAFSFTYVILYLRYFAGTPGAEAMGVVAQVKSWIATGPWGVFGAGYLGLLLVSTSFLAFGMWISSLTSDQVTSALGTVGGLLVFWIIGAGRIDTKPPWSDILGQLSLVEHSQNFAKGVINSHDIIFFLCFIFLFVFLTVQMLEVRKWKG